MGRKMRECIYSLHSGEMACREVEVESEEPRVEPKVVDPNQIQVIAELLCWELVDKGILDPQDCL